MRWAACLDTPSIAPISDQERSASRASRIAPSSAASTSSRRSTNSAMARARQCSPRRDRRRRPRRPIARGPRRVVLVSSSWSPPTFQELGSGRHRVNDRDAIGIIDDTDLQRLTSRGRSDVHRDLGIVGLEAPPVMSECMQHVVIRRHRACGARLDVHFHRLRREQPSSTHVDPTAQPALARAARPSPQNRTFPSV